VTADKPEACERRSDPDRPRRVPGLEAPAKRRAQVVVLRLHPIQGRHVGVEAERRRCLLDQGEEQVGVRRPDRRLLAAFVEALQREGPDGLEHPQPRLSAGHLAPAQKAVVHQRDQVAETTCAGS